LSFFAKTVLAPNLSGRKLSPLGDAKTIIKQRLKTQTVPPEVVDGVGQNCVSLSPKSPSA
jgi:hypothetical protein